MKSLYAALILAGSFIASASLAQSEAPPPPPPAPAPEKAAAPKATVMIGSSTCFIIRECAAGQTPLQRSDQIMDVFNKYLGGGSATFAVTPAGKNYLITMNKDKLIVVTPQDAKSAKSKNAAQLASAWKASLTKAFNETKAIK